jgi:hypothetical protein
MEAMEPTVVLGAETAKEGYLFLTDLNADPYYSVNTTRWTPIHLVNIAPSIN